MAKKKQVANRNVRLLLNETIRHLGKVGDVVEVKPGYARNYLLPHNLAVMPTPENLKRIESKRQEYERLETQRRQRQQTVLTSLMDYEVVLERRANERGHLYGGISASDIARALREAGVGQAQDVEIEAGDINLHGKIDHVGTFTAEIRFSEQLLQELKVTVNPDAESRATMEGYRREQKSREPEPARSQPATASA